MATFVLVPGAWSGSWGWQWLAPHLQAAGHDVHSLTLTGLGDRVHLANQHIDLDMHITDVVNALTLGSLSAVTLVGHSYSGMVVTGVADRVPERLSQVIYLDADVPEDGQCSYDVEPNGEAYRVADRRDAVAAGTPDFVPPPVSWIEEVIADASVRERVLTLLVPHPIATFTQPIRLHLPDSARVPRSFIRCTAGIDPGEPEPAYLDRIRTDPAWRYRELAYDHLAPVTAPRPAAEALLALVQPERGLPIA